MHFLKILHRHKMLTAALCCGGIKNTLSAELATATSKYLLNITVKINKNPQAPYSSGIGPCTAMA